MFRCRSGRFAALVCVLGWTVSTGVGAAPAHGGGRGTQAPPTTVRFIDAPSAESPAARQKRLKRECKGRPNAGACLGHTGRD
ncbi:MAG: hypothetical protein ACR2JA_01495 [Hydrogenophaga sp.]|uniref:hypothetical protein n=1 Tax=Hydrogenophaga sp. TaxID=1904254 RepID=UPI003D9BF610